MKNALAISACFICASFSAHAQDISNPLEVSTTVAPLQAIAAAPAPSAVLPGNTEVLLRMNQDITTRGDTWDEGDSFTMSVVHPVMLGGYIVIPAGTRAVGRITYLTSKGAFGKSGKMDVELDYLELSGRRIDINGTYRQEGEGNTIATVGGVIVAGLFAGFITGRSATIPQGRELMATLETDLPVALPDGVTVSQGTPALMIRR